MTDYPRLLSMAPHKAAVVQKEVVARVISRLRPIYLVNEFPKSGGTWLKFMLSDALKCPAWTSGRPAWGSCVMQAHWIHSRGRCRTVVLFRDGRDVMVSFYYHCFFVNEFRNEPLVKLMRRRFDFKDYQDIRPNLLPFMQSITAYPGTPGFSWKQFVGTWASRANIVRCRYEDLRLDTASELIRLSSALNGTTLDRIEADEIAERYSMANMRKHKASLNPGATGRQRAEISFIRKGKVGAWTESFSDDALAWFDDVNSAELTELGYTKGRPDEH